MACRTVTSLWFLLGMNLFAILGSCLVLRNARPDVPFGFTIWFVSVPAVLTALSVRAYHVRRSGQQN